MAVDRHRLRPLCCTACGKPMSVREKRSGITCAWDENLRLREQFEEVTTAMWLGGVLQEADDPPEEHAPEVYWISEGDLFG
jgi:hypothetical protein